MGSSDLSRREFIKGAAGLHLGAFLTAHGMGPLVIRRVPVRKLVGETQADLTALVPLNIFVSIDTDGTVTITNPRPDMGQGPRTSLPMHLAEELEVEWQQVEVVQADADRAYGNQTSGGSTSTRNFWDVLRQQGATAREMLIAAAADRWGVAESECRAEGGKVVHEPTGRELSYGELAEAASRLPEPSNVRLKSPSEYRIIGTPTKRVDAPLLVDGEAKFGYDIKVPDMVHVVIARPRWFGGSVRSYDDTEALKVPGVRQTFRFGGGVAVAADHTWAAMAGREALQIDWNEGGNTDLDDDVIRRRLRDRAEEPPDLPAETTVRLDAAYEVPYLSHAPMEPMNCVVDFRGNRCEVWAPTQAAGTTQTQVARTLGLSEDDVTVHVTFVGGGFGRRLAVDYATEAARLSREIGAPVQVCWSRDDDMRHDNYRPASHHKMRGGLNAAGDVIAFHHRAAIATRGSDLASSELLAGGEAHAPEQETPRYDIPALSARTRSVGFPIPTGAWRSVNNTQWCFANESFLDELAAAGGHDPFELRRRLVNNTRLRGCLELAASKAGWGSELPHGTGRGIACFYGYGTYVAQVVEASVSPAGEVTVNRVVCAVDCGITVNPLGASAQLEGATCDGLSTALKAAITIKGGAVEQSSFRDYEWFRMADMPEVEVHFVESDARPQGLGEPGFPAVSPALCNAIYAVTSRRVRRLPIRQEDLAGWEPEPTPTPTSQVTPPATPTATTEPPPDSHKVYLPWTQRP